MPLLKRGQNRFSPDDPREVFLSRVTGRLKGWDTRFLVREELRAHLEDQTRELEEEMDFPQAARAAVERMGDPEELGRQLAQVHRPGTPWLPLCLTGAALVMGLWVGVLFASSGAGWSLLFSLGALLLAYRWGAFLAGRFPGVLLGAGALLGAVCLLWGSQPVNGMGRWAFLYGQYLCPFLPAAFALMMTRLEGRGIWGVLLCGGAWLLSAGYCLLLPRASWALAVTLADLALLTAACAGGWFGPGRSLQLGTIWVPAGVGILGLLAVMIPRAERLTSGWIYEQNREVWGQVLPWGGGGAELLPGWENDFLFTGLASRLGWVAAAAAAAAITALAALLLWKSSRLTRPGHRMAAQAAALTLLLQTVLTAAASTGAFPAPSLWVPFLDPGIRAGMSTAALTGFCLSFLRAGGGQPVLDPLPAQ